jgi:hypothetical protein
LFAGALDLGLKKNEKPSTPEAIGNTEQSSMARGLEAAKIAA